MKPVLLALVFVLAAAGLGWWMAPPQPPSQLDNSAGLPALQATAETGNSAGVGSALATIYQRGVWSSQNPEELAEAETAGEGSAEEAEPAAPEGLDRFRLVGVIRVGEKTEALLLDEGVTETSETNSQPVTRAAPGEQLNNTGVILVSINNRRAQLQLQGETRWLDLYPDYQSLANEPNE